MSVLSASPLPAFEMSSYSHPSSSYSPSPTIYNCNGEYSSSSAYDSSHHQQLVARQPQSALLDAVQPAAQGYLTALAHVMLTSSFSSPIVSERGMLVVHGYSPLEGEAEALLTVNAEMRVGDGLDPSDPVVPNTDSQPDLKLRIVLGRTALRTFVRDTVYRLENDPNGGETKVFKLRICAQIPTYQECQFTEQAAVPITLQTLTEGAVVYDSVTFGTFTYWQPSVFLSR
ncbi:hypothetical protein SCHPADRAFT_67333 [Schizopora paradoxa]|uniref:Uncharacterized protein n=1 Tax=Schizopora paradoxa TaxID=27342 RepID=A0A0H2SR63_9AGAM|nr:hypothetical protein SCHPADRAFT_67333 [Schizopora paradoxa]